MKIQWKVFGQVLLSVFLSLITSVYSVHADSISPSIEITGGVANVCTYPGPEPIIPVIFNLPVNSSDRGIMSVQGVGIVNTITETSGAPLNGPGSYGFNNPTPYAVAANTPITMSVLTYSGPSQTGALSYVAEIVFNCTTGAVISLKNGPPQGILYKIDPESDPHRILQLDPDNGTIINAFNTPVNTSESTGLAYALGRLFFTTENNNSIYELNQGYGGVINVLTKPSAGAEDALGFSGTSLYVLDGNADTLYVLNPDTGATVNSFVFPFNTCGGLTYAGGRNSVFISDCSPDPNIIYEINPNNGSVINSFTTPAGADIWGLGYSITRGTLFLGQPNSSNIYEVNPDTGAIINTLSTSSITSALAADENGMGIPALSQLGVIIFMLVSLIGAIFYLDRKKRLQQSKN